MDDKRKPDRRVVKTKRAIRNAFVALMVEKEVEKISIKEIAERADVDRKTIYNYYGGVYDILNELENEVVETFNKLTLNVEGDYEEVTAGFFVEITKVFDENLELYGQLLKINYSSRLMSKITEYLRAKMRRAIERNRIVAPSKVEIAAEYVLSGMFWAYRYWFNSDRKIPLEDFSKEVGLLVMKGLPEYVKE
jgi:AcrR family transcriptional regulator